MLREIKNLRQERTSGRRRWFESDGLDLVVWFDAADRLTGFQLCYGRGPKEHALTWREGHGFSHNAIDSGDDTPLKNLTPILQPDGETPWTHLAHTFEESSDSLEPELRRLIRSKLAEGGKPG